MKSPFKDKPNIRRYCIIPARAMQDDRLGRGELRVLMCLGMYANQYGVCWPSQYKIGLHIGVSRVWISECTAKLIKLGYIRKLEPRPYPKGIKRRSGRRCNRYQILWEGNDPMPTLEQFWAPQPRFAAFGPDDVDDEPTPMQSGVKGEESKDHQILAHTFAKAVESVIGQSRVASQSFSTAKTLADQGVTVDQVRSSTVEMCKTEMKAGRSAPRTLDQVAKWAGLYKK